MLIGDPAVIAVESKITVAYEDPGLRALGLFVLHVGGIPYGVKAADATLLANSYDRVLELIAGRGSHLPPFSPREDAHAIARVISEALYADIDDHKYYALSRSEFTERVYRTIWAPDGDRAFDDGSHVLLFDVGVSVRVLGFRHLGDGNFAHESVRESWIPADEFYRLLQEWSDAFFAKWQEAPKS